MKRLDNYIGQTVLLACLLVLFAIIGLDVLFGLIDELNDINQRYTIWNATRYVLLSVPASVYEFIPLSCLVGCLIGLGLLAGSSELTVVRAAGVSKLRIVLSVCRPVLLLILFAAALGEYVVPLSSQQAAVEKAKSWGQGDNHGVRYGVWNREGDWFMRFNAIERNGTVHGLALYQFDPQRQLLSTRHANRAQYIDGVWHLTKQRSTYFEQGRTRVERKDEALWQSQLKPELLALLAQEPTEMSIQALLGFNDYMASQNLSSRPHQLELWGKLLQPLAIFSLVLIAVSFVFGSLRSVPMGQRVLVGIIVGLVFKFSQDLLGPASTVYGFSPLVAVLTPILACILVGGWLLRRGS
jgi:lipopolysaccharide export system permease protein